MQKNIYAGKFIVFEGLDGSGQTTQANLLRDFLVSDGYDVVFTKEPTKDSKMAEKIHAALNKMIDIGYQSLQELFAKDRQEHLERVVIPALKAGKIVISDRYFFSSFAYGAALGLDLEWLIKINHDFLLPDITIILRVSPELCMDRIEKRGGRKTLFEDKEKLRKVWEIYEQLPNRFENVYIIDGQKSVEDVFEEVKSLVRLKIRNRRGLSYQGSGI